MLMALTVEQPARSILRRWSMSLRGEDLQWKFCSYAGNRYLRVTWCGREEDIPWQRVSGITNRPRTPILLPEGMFLPPGCPMRAYEPSEFFARLVVQAACQCLTATPDRAHRATIGIIDPQGIAPWAAALLAPLCRTLRVYSLRPDRYAVQEQMLLEEAGVPLLYAETPQGLRDCLFCVAPYPTGVFGVPAPVITPDRSGIQGNPTVNRLSLGFTQEQLAVVPPGIRPELFFGALSETGFHRFPLPLVVEQCRIDGRLAAFSDFLPSLARAFLP